MFLFQVQQFANWDFSWGIVVGKAGFGQVLTCSVSTLAASVCRSLESFTPTPGTTGSTFYKQRLANNTNLL
jgi:hypothetical protein